MIKFYSKYFIEDDSDSLNKWLNDFESKRNGRPMVEYNIEIDKILKTQSKILVIVRIHEYEV